VPRIWLDVMLMCNRWRIVCCRTSDDKHIVQFHELMSLATLVVWLRCLQQFKSLRLIEFLVQSVTSTHSAATFYFCICWCLVLCQIFTWHNVLKISSFKICANVVQQFHWTILNYVVIMLLCPWSNNKRCCVWIANLKVVKMW